jgi:hypothetical protein
MASPCDSQCAETTTRDVGRKGSLSATPLRKFALGELVSIASNIPPRRKKAGPPPWPRKRDGKRVNILSGAEPRTIFRTFSRTKRKIYEERKV